METEEEEKPPVSPSKAELDKIRHHLELKAARELRQWFDENKHHYMKEV